MSGILKKIAAIIAALISTFHGEKDSTGGKSMKVASGFAFLCGLDWFLAGLTFSLVVGMKAYHWKEMVIFFVMWAVNIVLAGSILLVNDLSGIDITTMEGRKRWLKALGNGKNLLVRILCAIFEFFYCIFLIIWDGAEYFIIFSRDRIGSLSVKVFLFLAASAIQMAIWTKIYSFGYESVAELIKHYWK